MKLLTLESLPSFVGVRVIVRAGFDTPLNQSGAIADTYRIDRGIPTIDFLRRKGAIVLVMSHMGRDESETLYPVFEYLVGKMRTRFARDFESNTTKRLLDDARPGDVIVFENVRRHRGEISNEESFAQFLASFGTVYVNDAFSASHRLHASIVGIPKYLPGYAGFLLADEIANLERALTPHSPSLFILGGAKFETKQPLIRKLLPIYDHVFVGGALANDFFKARGLAIGSSKISSEPVGDIAYDPKIILPSDVVVDPGGATKSPSDIGVDEIVVDAGSHTLQELHDLISSARSILWNGPLGTYEKGYDHSTIDIASAVANREADSIVGGGDTLSAISKLNLYDHFSFVSTGGGAMLEFLAGGTLPGIEALVQSQNTFRA